MGHNKINSYTDFYYVFFRNTLLVLLPVTIIIGLVLSIPRSSATTTNSDQVIFNISTSCTMSSEVTSPHTADLNGGQHKVDVGTTKLNAYCNDNNGYSIYAVGTSNGIFGNTDLVSSVSNDYNIHTNIYNSSTVTSSTPSSWSMKLTAGVGTGINPTTGESVPITPPTILNNYDNYNVIPNAYTLVAKRISSTDMTTDTTASGSYLTTTYDIYANSLQPSGTYTGAVKYLMMHPAITPENIFMQNVAEWKDSLLKDVGDSIQAIDERDGKGYWVTKLKDGNIWMTQNLDLDLETTPNKVATLTSENTDLNLYGSMGYDSSNGYSCSNPNTTANCTASGEVITWAPERSNINFQNTTVTDWVDNNRDPYSANKTDSNETDHASLGNYYNWTAAISSNNSSDYITGTAANSICPKGWQLPSTISNNFGTLLREYNIIATNTSASYLPNGFNKIIATPLYFSLGGSINSGTITEFQDYGGYWQGTSANSDTSYYLYFGSSTIQPLYYRSKARGRLVRCIAK